MVNLGSSMMHGFNLNKRISAAVVFIIAIGLSVAGCGGQAAQEAINTTEAPAPVMASATPKADDTETPIPTATVTPEPTATPAPPEWPAAGIEVKSETDIRLAAELGTTWIRRNALQWHKIEPVPGERKWEEAAWLDAELKLISEAGMEAVLIVRGAPDWALRIAGPTCGAIKSEAMGDFAAFLKEAVVRYKDAPYNVKYWELGNEPDVDPSLTSLTSPFGCWGDIADSNYYGGAYYAEMLKVAYPAIKATDPEAQVLVGGLLMDCDPVKPPETSPGSGQLRYCTPSRYLEGILANGGGDYFDGVSFHAYDYYNGAEGQYGNGNWYSAWNTTGPVMAAKAGYLRALLSSFGYSDKFLMNTENALLCGRDGTEAECQAEAFQKTKDYYVVQASTMAVAEGLRSNVWYDLRGWRGSGLIDKARQPLPAFQAYQFNIKMLAGMGYWGKVEGTPGIMGYEFRQGARVVWVIWAVDGEAHPLEIPGELSKVYDGYGSVLESGSAVNVTIAPMYVEWMVGE